jgi:hypothetical protein
VDECGAGVYRTRPRSLTLTCADAGVIANRLVWSSWTTTEAVASGRAAVNDCTPNCAGGHVHEFPAELFLSDVQRHGRLIFTVATLKFTGTLPSGWRRVSRFPIPLPHPG